MHERCQACEILVINNTLCHERGCPEAYKTEKRECQECGFPFTPENPNQRLCSESCAENSYESCYS